MKTRIIIIATVLLCLAECADRVLLRDVTAITLIEGTKTQGRRSSPVPQLRCVGGSAYGKVQTPNIVQCKNVGFDGSDVQWECKAEMDSRVKFGPLTVNCEGYAYPEDPYILKGSCGLEYELDWKSSSERSSNVKHSISSWSFESLLTSLAILFIIGVALYMMCTAASGTGEADPPGFRRFGTGFDHGPGGPPGGGPGGHPGYPGSGPPPKYNDLFGSSTGSGGARPQGAANDGPGFWTGAGLGALGGYFMGRQQNQGQARYRGHNAGDEYARTGGFSSSDYRRTDDDQPSSSNTARQTSTGYGGTTRR